MSVNGKSATVTDVEPHIDTLPANASALAGNNIDDLVPDILKNAVSSKAPDAHEIPPPPSKETPAPAAADDDDEEPDDEGDSGNLDSASVDISPAGIDALISGTPLPEKKAVDHQLPPWKESESYKTFSKRLKNLGVKETDLDGLITEISDSRVVESGSFLKSITDERDALKSRVEHNDTEIARLRAMEKVAHFDNSPEVSEKFIKPMLASTNEVQRVLEVAGGNIPAVQIMRAASRPEVMQLLQNVPLEETELTSILNHWKNYKDLELKYTTERSTARTELARHLSTEVPENIGKKIFEDTFMTALKDDTYKYLKDAITEGLEKHPDLQEVVGISKRNFMNLLKIIGNPVDHAKNHSYLSNLARFSLKNAHDQHYSKKYFDLEKVLVEKNEALRSLAVAYQKLKGSARGLQGKPGRQSAPPLPNGKSRQDEADSTVKELEGFLNGRMKIDDFMSS